MQTTVSTELSIETLRDLVTGTVIGPDDEAYDAARVAFAGGIDKHPAAIVRVADAKDVAAVIALARRTGVPLSVRSGGHSATGQCLNDGGLVIDLRDLKGIEIDVTGKTVWADAGLTAVELSQATAQHDLAIGFGDTGSVGIGGITLGGGVGYLVRKHGLTIDNLIAADIVTADGEVRRVDEKSHPDLFWAIRGGGGNFGVATRFQFRVHDLGTVFGGMLLLPATPETVAGFIAAAEAAPDELSTIANVMPAPPMPFLPPEVHGRLSIMALIVYAGDPKAGEHAVAPLRALATPLADMLHPMPYPEIYPPEDDSYHPLAVARTLFIDRFDIDTARLIVDRLGASDAAMRVAQLRVLGGAEARVPADATAYAHRGRTIMVNIASFYGPDDHEIRERWVTEFVAALGAGERPGAYVNFLAEDGPARIHEAYPGPTWDRLVEIKRRYDPDNLFQLNQNIDPNGAAGVGASAG
jgi:FAD binding domain/Berberine and berberine like